MVAQKPRWINIFEPLHALYARASRKWRRTLCLYKMKTKEDFFAVVDEHMAPLQLLYQQFADRNPVMEIILPAGRIGAYPYSEYSKTLSVRSQKMLREEYRDAKENGQMVVFVKDENEKVLKSATIPIKENQQET